MTTDEYRAAVRALGFTRLKPSYEGASVYQGRDGLIVNIPDPETMSPEEREDFLILFKEREGFE